MVIVVAIVTIIGFTLAYFTDSASTEGIINTGKLSIKISKQLNSITNWNPGDVNNISFKYKSEGASAAVTRYKLIITFADTDLINEINNGNMLLLNLSDKSNIPVSLTKKSDGVYETNWLVNNKILNGTAENYGEDESEVSFNIGLAIAAGNVYSDVTFNIKAEVEAIQAKNTVINSDGTSKNLTAEQINAIFADTTTVARTETGEIATSN